MRKSTLLTILGSCLCVLSAYADKLDFSTTPSLETKASLKLASPMEELPAWGYYPVIATMRNDGTKTASWNIKTTSESGQSYRDDNTNTHGEFHLSCEPGTTRSVELLVPVSLIAESSSYWGSSHNGYDQSSTNLNFEISDGKTKSGDYLQSNILTGNAHALVSHAVYKVMQDSSRADNVAGYFNPSLLGSSIESLRGYDFLIMSQEEWRKLDKTVRSTLLDWVKSGGSLALCQASAKSPLSAEQLELPLPKANKRKNIYTLQEGKIHLLESSYLTGKHFENMILQASKKSHHHLNNNFDEQSKWPLHHSFGSKIFGATLLMFILFIFAIFVGPINFFGFAKQGRRHKLFFTTTMISLGTSLLLIAAIFLQDGVGGKGVQLVLKEIDSESKKAHVKQEQFCRTGMLLGTSFTTDQYLTIEQVPIQHSSWSRVSDERSKANYTVTPTESGIHCSGNYFQSRSEHGHYLEASVITQERFDVRKSGDLLFVTSSFAHPIESFYFVDGAGQTWSASALTTGAEVAASKVPASEYKTWIRDQKAICSKQLALSLSKRSKRPNSFIALTTQAPGLQTHKSIDWETTTLLSGVITL